MESSLLQVEANIERQRDQAVYSIDSPSVTSVDSLPSSNDENQPRVKFLCSFSGSILPRPQDGKLRYVGGETRIVGVPRDISYEELMGKMRDIYEGAVVLKYQQPDEDLDALVSVVNDDDVTNMMEEYDKLGSGDGFTRLRIFLFSHLDQDGSTHFIDADGRETERLYMDALNSLNDASDLRNLGSELSGIGTPDDIHVAEHYFNQMSLDGGVYNQQSYDIPFAQFNLRHLNIPRIGSGHLQQMDAPWSPVIYSPMHSNPDPRPVADFSNSPSSAQYRSPYGEFSERSYDRMPEEYGRQLYDRQSPYADSVVWGPRAPALGDRSGFPGNILHGPNVYDGNSICENCRMTFQRNQAYPDSPWKHGEQPHSELQNMGSGFIQVPSACSECLPNREHLLTHADAKFQHGLFPREQNDARAFYNELHSYERGYEVQAQSSSRIDEPWSHISRAGRPNDNYVMDGPGMNIPNGTSNLLGGNHVKTNYAHHEDSRIIRPVPELGNEMFHDRNLAPNYPSHDERGSKYGNFPFVYGADTLYQALQASSPSHTLRRHVHTPAHGASPYEVSPSSPLSQLHGLTSPGFVRGSQEGSPRIPIGADNQNIRVEPSQKMAAFDGSIIHGNSFSHPQNVNQHSLTAENSQFSANTSKFDTTTEPLQLSDSEMSLANYKLVGISGSEVGNGSNVTRSAGMEGETRDEGKSTSFVDPVKDAGIQCSSVVEGRKNMDEVTFPESDNFNNLRPDEGSNGIIKIDVNGVHCPVEDYKASEGLSLPVDLIGSPKKTALEDIEDVNVKALEVDVVTMHETTIEETNYKSEAADVNGETELGSEYENPINSKIELTKAEAEAIEKGLQTIKNDDLEEIRELGFGTYGAVYHGKWRGSDVAIKRIKACCFAGRPSERERLIADFWKEALILSSLHHPNVVSFYGIVRDGPDGSLATVTEFMINGSLKQFLQKKDRTIDRRKRLILAMDAAFGMEYLHGKNIVHFDLKCENLLVNMRDPHRPVCKIGDLGLSKVKQHTLVSGGVRGTLPWMAPELLSGKSNMVTEKIDVYSFGIVMWELLTGDEPYADMRCASIIGGIVNNALRPTTPTWCDPEWKSLMESCWASDPPERPSFSEISQRLRNMAAAMNVK